MYSKHFKAKMTFEDLNLSSIEYVLMNYQKPISAFLKIPFNCSKLSEQDLNSIIEEVDEDGSGTLDFDGKIFCGLKGHSQDTLRVF
jgi:hypothetical protein